VDLLHESLEGSWGRRKSERQYLPLPEPIASNECCLVLSIRTEGYLPVPAKQIQSTEVLATRESIQRLVYPGKRVSVLNGYAVESAVVYSEPPATILLLGQDYWRAPRTVGRLDQIPVEKILHLTAHLLLRAQTSSWLSNGDGAGCQGYFVGDDLGQPHVFVAATENITVLHQ